MRAIVTLPGVTLGEPQFFSISPTEPVEFRQWLLYWDKVAAVNTFLIQMDDGPEMAYLKQVGMLQSHHVDVGGGEGTDILKRARQKLFEKLSSEDAAAWSIHTSASETGPHTEARALRIQLANALPIPTGDVPLEDVFAFRERRKSEREALLQLIDEAYLSIQSSPDKPLAEMLAMERLVAGARQHMDVYRETKWPFRLMDIAADFNLAPAVATALGFGTVSVAVGATWPNVVGNSLLAGASISVGKVASLFSTKERTGPYRYLSAYSEEVFSSE